VNGLIYFDSPLGNNDCGVSVVQFESVPAIGGPVSHVGPTLNIVTGSAAFDPAGIYAGLSDDPTLFGATSIIRTPLDGGEMSTLGTGKQIVFVTTNGTYAFWVDFGNKAIMRSCK
jgi:hypothetical protein